MDMFPAFQSKKQAQLDKRNNKYVGELADMGIAVPQARAAVNATQDIVRANKVYLQESRHIARIDAKLQDTAGITTRLQAKAAGVNFGEVKQQRSILEARKGKIVERMSI